MNNEITNVVFAGLGGQGVLKASDILAQAAFARGLDVKKSEIHGMSQRGGSVTSDVRFGREVLSPMVSDGDADYVIGFPESAKFNFSVTKGIISNLISNDVYFGTDAQIDRGNSGGAAVNSAGQLIGLPTYKYVGGGDYRGYILDIHSLNLN